MRQVDLTLESALQQRPGLRGLDAAVVDAVGKDDEVAGEPVTADVGRLPDPLLVDLLAHGVVERPAELRAAAIVLAMGAHEEERVLDLIAGARKIELEQVVVALELDAAQRPLRLGRARHERDEPVPAAALLAADEEDPALRQGGPLPAEVRLQLGRERRAVHGVVSPEPAVLDQDPRVDPAGRRAERLGVRERDLGAERLARIRSTVAIPAILMTAKLAVAAGQPWRV